MSIHLDTTCIINIIINKTASKETIIPAIIIEVLLSLIPSYNDCTPAAVIPNAPIPIFIVPLRKNSSKYKTRPTTIAAINPNELLRLISLVSNSFPLSLFFLAASKISLLFIRISFFQVLWSFSLYILESNLSINFSNFSWKSQTWGEILYGVVSYHQKPPVWAAFAILYYTSTLISPLILA